MKITVNTGFFLKFELNKFWPRFKSFDWFLNLVIVVESLGFRKALHRHF